MGVRAADESGTGGAPMDAASVAALERTHRLAAVTERVVREIRARIDRAYLAPGELVERVGGHRARGARRAG